MLDENDMLCGRPYGFTCRGEKYLEFHVDDCPEFATWSEWSDWSDSESVKFGGNLSVRFHEGSKQIDCFWSIE